jgi:hypothetical protein
MSGPGGALVDPLTCEADASTIGEIFMARRSIGRGLIAWLVAGLLAAGLFPAATKAIAQESPGAGEPSAPRVRLDLKPAQREMLKRTMREHLAALEAIVAALSRQDYRKAADIAHLELGFPKHHEAMQRERGAALPEQYQKFALEHHRAAEALAGAIARKDMPPILRELARTIQTCTACHRAYTL